jgi:pimeloyl-ACP methyl ester carboxylesterase
MTTTHATAETRFIEVDGARFAYRRWGNPAGVPLFFVQHFRGGMDNWDPYLTDGLAEDREIILFNGRGVASSSGEPRNTFEAMAEDIAAVIRALGLSQVDLLGFSIGGFEAQEVAIHHPELVRKLLLVGTGPRGGVPMLEPEVLAVATKPVPDAEDFLYLFFGRSEEARQAGFAFLQRRFERADQDPPISDEGTQAQVQAMEAYAAHTADAAPFDRLKGIQQPTLVVNGTDDIMIASINSWHLVQNIPNAQLIIYPDAGHGSPFQYPERFLQHAKQFLAE